MHYAGKQEQGLANIYGVGNTCNRPGPSDLSHHPQSQYLLSLPDFGDKPGAFYPNSRCLTGVGD